MVNAAPSPMQFQQAEDLPTRKPSAEGLLARAMYFPNTIDAGEKGESHSDVTLNATMMVSTFEDPAMLPPPPSFDDEVASPIEDVLDGLDPDELSKFNSSTTGDPPPPPADLVAEYFVCCQCAQEGYGEMDERDGNFYCNACWSEYMGVAPEEPGAGADTESGPSIDNPTHPDYWTNLKQNNVSQSSKGDIFAEFARQSATPASGDGEASTTQPSVIAESTTPETKQEDAKNLDVVLDAMLVRIQDKRKSMRFDKAGKGKRFFKKKEGKRKVDVKKKKKKKVDPKTLFAEAPPLGDRGLLVKEPVNALPIPPPQRAPVKRLKPMRAVILFGQVAADGTVWRPLYHFGDDRVEAIEDNGFQEAVRPATTDWEDKGLPVRPQISQFILDDFGGVVDTNSLGCLAPPVAPPDYT
jgi:hypothetical protein